MKRQDLYDLIRAHFEKNENDFFKKSKQIARDLTLSGEKKLAIEIRNLIRKNNIMGLSQKNANMENMILNNEQKKWINIIRTGFMNNHLNKIFLYGSPGTGKTSFAHLLSNELSIDLHSIHLSHILDCKLGESMKLMDKIFKKEGKQIIFIDEIDSIASRRDFSNDIFEIKRVLNHLLQLIDSLKTNKLLIVATNMENYIDEAFIRRFDLSFNFNDYKKNHILDIFNVYSEKYSLYQFSDFTKNLEKLISCTYDYWTPGYIKRIIQISSLWLKENETPKNQIIEILKLIKIGNEKNKIKNKLEELKVPIKTINYLIK